MTKNNSKVLLDDIMSVVLEMKNKNDLFSFLRDLLTEKEIKELSNRFIVAQRLNAKTSYVDIEKETGMSSTTIARVSKFLKWDYEGYKKALEIMQKLSKHNEDHKS